MLLGFINETPTQMYLRRGGLADLSNALQVNKFFWNQALKLRSTLIDINNCFIFTPSLCKSICFIQVGTAKIVNKNSHLCCQNNF